MRTRKAQAGGRGECSTACAPLTTCLCHTHTHTRIQMHTRTAIIEYARVPVQNRRTVGAARERQRETRVCGTRSMAEHVLKKRCVTVLCRDQRGSRKVCQRGSRKSVCVCLCRGHIQSPKRASQGRTWQKGPLKGLRIYRLDGGLGSLCTFWILQCHAVFSHRQLTPWGPRHSTALCYMTSALVSPLLHD